mmetsp:Transcript_62859/g.203731  ORF Transcript_62859/g.203731 Transcript_62859/m.203731 type:complete len:294 (-) Transcript_62859:106-987(-)
MQMSAVVSFACAQALPQEFVLQGSEKGPGCDAGGTGVAALRALVQVRPTDVLGSWGPGYSLQAAHHLSRVPRVHTVVPRRGREEHRGLPEEGLAAGRVHHVVRGHLPKMLPVRRVVWVAILRDPAGTGQQAMVDPHVQQRHLPDEGAKPVRRARQHVAHEKTSVRAAEEPQPVRRHQALVAQVVRHRLQVFIRLQAPCFPSCVAPRWPELTPTTNVGLHVCPATLQPSYTHVRQVRRQHWNPKAPVSVHQSGHVRHALTPRQKIRNAGAIFRDGLELHCLHASRIIKRNKLPQ